MSTLLLKHIAAAVTCDGEDRLLRDIDIFCQDGTIRAMGPALAVEAEETIDCTGMLCYPGLVNTHHHLYQCFSRNLPQVQNLELFDWLRALYEIWKNLDGESVLLTVDGETTDVTGRFSESEAYVRTAQGADGRTHVILVGGTAEEPHTAEIVVEADGTWTCSTDAPEDSPWFDAYVEANLSR